METFANSFLPGMGLGLFTSLGNCLACHCHTGLELP